MNDWAVIIVKTRVTKGAVIPESHHTFLPHTDKNSNKKSQYSDFLLGSQTWHKEALAISSSVSQSSAAKARRGWKGV